MPDFDWFALPPLISGIITAVVGLAVFRRQPASRPHQIFGLICLSLTIWLLGFSGMYLSRDEPSALRWARSALIGIPFIPPTMYHFVLTFLNLKQPRLLTALYLSGLLGLALSQTPLIYDGIWAGFWGYYPTAGPIYVVFPLIFLGCFVGGVLRLWAALKREQNPIRRQQLKYLMLAFACGTPGVIDYLAKFRLNIYPCGYLAALAWISWIAYAIVRHRLMDIDVVIRKSVVYSILIALITATYLAVLVLVEQLLRGLVGYRSAVGTVLASFLIALGFIPVRNAVQRWVDRLFFGGSQEALARENERLRQELIHVERLKSVSLLAAGLAHEIKNPLAVLKTFTEFLPEKHTDPAFLEKFQRLVGHEIDKMHGIVLNLLAFAKPQPASRQPVELAELIRETLTLLQGDCLKRRVAVRVEADGPAAFVTGDRQQLKQVLLNLLLNSLEAMPDGGTVALRLQPNGQAVELAIQDTGLGIEPGQLPYVFDPFFTTKPTGTGLGLSVVHGILKEHGGTIRLSSQPGQGTTATVRLPLAEQTQDARPQTQEEMDGQPG